MSKEFLDWITNILPKLYLAGFTFYLTALCRSHMAICERHNCFIILKTNFWDFEFVFGAKVIYFFHWFQIWRNFWRARTSARAARAYISSIWAKNSEKMSFCQLWSALSARGSARAQNLFSYLNSPNPGDNFCTFNHKKMLKIEN